MMVLMIVMMNARKPNVAKDPTLPVGHPDRPVSTSPLLSLVVVAIVVVVEETLWKEFVAKKMRKTNK